MNKKILLLVWLPAIFMMVIIFRFSSSTGIKSSGLSSNVTDSLFNTMDKIVDLNLTPEAELKWKEMIHTPLRKAGHFTEYALLSITVSLPLYIVHKKRGRVLFLYTLSICFLYACTDEIHQLFVPERSGQFTDVLIDSAGACFGCFLFWVFLILKNRRNK
ncbi:VanZ family protein [Anaerocolumna cellulosilytica]|uniref:VanZ family protein n=1 Tax=Anaerocolumna cellulosilytica TaxID=433286 RepID=UPI00160D74CF|nr:VanZ family protein [Anaerocolumna cellulosilytica]MBB5195134.1 VanZ family protein [Anaerocolumna cellulosilytica]